MAIGWKAWGTTVRLDVTDPRAMPSALRIVRSCVREAERAADVDRRRAEVHRLVRAGGRPVRVTATLAALVAVALDVAERTDGAVDPTVGGATVPLRAALRRAAASGGLDGGRATGGGNDTLVPACAAYPWVAPRPAAGWRAVDWSERRLAVPPPAALDLSATAKARTARLAATRVAERLGVGAMVEIGGDVATVGPRPGHGWVVSPEHAGGTVLELAAGEAVAACRAAQVVDPLTGRLVATGWEAVVVTADDVVTAKAAAISTLVLGEPALGRFAGARGRTLLLPAAGATGRHARSRREAHA